MEKLTQILLHAFFSVWDQGKANKCDIAVKYSPVILAGNLLWDASYINWRGCSEYFLFFLVVWLSSLIYVPIPLNMCALAALEIRLQVSITFHDLWFVFPIPN